MTGIVQVYVKLIQEGRRTLEQVPEQIRTEVEAALQGAEQT